MSEYLYFTGIAKWPRLVRVDEEYDCWSVVLYPDSKSRKAFDKSGLTLTPKSDEDGEFVTFRRKREVKFGSEVKIFDPPKVIDKDGNDLDASTIGNGSKVTLKVEVYDTKKKGKGHRLHAVKVEDLVVYERAPDDRF